MESTTPAAEFNPSEPVNVALANGSVVKGATIGEAFDNLRQMYENTATWAKEQKQKAEEASAEAERLRAEVEQRQQTIQQAATHQNTGFDRERYFDLLNEDPLAAQNYLDQVRFGVTDPVSAFNSMREESWANIQQNVAAAFITTHPEFNPADTKALSGRVQACLQYGMPFNAQTLDYAYDTLKREGSAKPMELTPEPEPELPPPSLSGPGGNLGSIPDADTLSNTDLESLLRSKGMIR